jgi:hypothetical protein
MAELARRDHRDGPPIDGRPLLRIGPRHQQHQCLERTSRTPSCQLLAEPLDRLELLVPSEQPEAGRDHQGSGRASVTRFRTCL